MSDKAVKNFWKNSSLQLLILVALGIIFFGNTLTNEYALDDGLVVTENPYTQQGFDGIDEILTKDAYQWYYEENNSAGELSGGRYRPLSIITFAIEYEIFGENPTVSHAINLLIYLLSGILLFLLLKNHWTPRRPMLSFLTPLLFLIHPIHTEAVANIKGRDELLAFFLLFASLLLLFRFLKNKNGWQLLWSVLLYFLALMSKENGITFLAVIPLSIYFFSKSSVQNIAKYTLPFVGVGAAYLLIRYQVVGLGAGGMDDVMNDPFLYATWAEEKATALFILLKYLQLQFWPHPLSYDYGFQQIAYKTFSDPWVIISILVHLGILIAGIIGLAKKRIWSFAALYYLVTLSIISNIFIPLGGTMGERLIYLSSFGFVLALSWALIKLYLQLPERSAIPIAQLFLTIVILAAGYKTITRNQDWYSNETLFLTDVKKVPNSIKANTAAANEYINQYLETEETRNLTAAINYYNKAIELYPVKQDSFKRSLFLFNNYLNQTYSYLMLENLEQAEKYWRKAKSIKPFHQKVQDYAAVLSRKYLKQANEVAQNDLELAIDYYLKATEINPKNADAWYNLGGASYTLGDLQNAQRAFSEAVRIKPEHEKARQGLEAVNQMLRQQR